MNTSGNSISVGWFWRGNREYIEGHLPYMTSSRHTLMQCFMDMHPGAIFDLELESEGSDRIQCSLSVEWDRVSCPGAISEIDLAVAENSALQGGNTFNPNETKPSKGG